MLVCSSLALLLFQKFSICACACSLYVTTRLSRTVLALLMPLTDDTPREPWFTRANLPSSLRPFFFFFFAEAAVSTLLSNGYGWAFSCTSNMASTISKPHVLVESCVAVKGFVWFNIGWGQPRLFCGIGGGIPKFWECMLSWETCNCWRWKADFGIVCCVCCESYRDAICVGTSIGEQEDSLLLPSPWPRTISSPSSWLAWDTCTGVQRFEFIVLP